MALLEVAGIGKSFGSTAVLRDISFDLQKGEALAIIGSSGSGKTTLLRCLNFLETADTGSITVAGETLWSADDARTQSEAVLRKKRLHFGLVFQNFNLFPQYTALQNVIMPLLLRGLSRTEAIEQAEGSIRLVGLMDRIRHRPNELSGGQQQRVAIARALVTKPALLLADEPTGALDSTTGKEILALFRELNEAGNTIVMISHDVNVAGASKRIITISDGRISE